MKQTILIFSGIALAIYFAFQLNKYSMFIGPRNNDLVVILSAILFILIGFALKHFLSIKKPSNKKLYDYNKISNKTNLSKQEHKVLVLMAEGLSNNEIGKRLFIEESTVKSHVSNIFSKLNAKRRTEAVKIGRDLHII